MKDAKLLGLALFAVALSLAGAPVRADDAGRIADAREATMRLDLKKAHALLDSIEARAPVVVLERARLAIYEGDYDGASALLSNAELSRTNLGAELLAIADACARATAGAVTEVDAERGVVIRLQDESDRPLAPFMVEVAVAAREALAHDLKVDLPRPLRVELVRDLFTLAAMTGLPESAAQTTGTVAVAKWGRVTMITPRAVARGYPWADTLAHEMAHLAQTQASGDRAPLWLQEGVAKRQETRWRQGRHFDDFPAADSIAAVGLDKGLGRPIDKLGASIALLPSAEQAMVAFAEVSSFVRFWIDSTGEAALPELLMGLGSATDNASSDDRNEKNPVDEAMKAVTGSSLSDWNARWLTYLGTVKRELPPGTGLGGNLPHENEIRRGLALGELLRRRSHPEAAQRVLGPSQKLAPFDPLLRHRLASALYALGQPIEAEKLVSREEDVRSEFGPWMALHGRWLAEQGQPDKAAAAFQVGLELSPLDPEVACEEKMPPELPASVEKAPLCQAARSALQD
jgi:tetratricopeptide (TPR) repeat protein